MVGGCDVVRMEMLGWILRWCDEPLKLSADAPRWAILEAHAVHVPMNRLTVSQELCA